MTKYSRILLKHIIGFYIISSELLSLSYTLEASVNSCPISTSTVQVVESCPDSKEEWREAATRKNCSAYANQCDEPGRLEYHCVINSFINETLEVCAYKQNIVFGHCTDYSISGNLIKQNSKTNCKVFETKPCPLFYLSSEAYKYPGCYELTKRLTQISKIHIVGTIRVTRDIQENSSQHSPTEKQNGLDDSTGVSIFIAFSLFSFCLLTIATFLFVCRKKAARKRSLEKLTGSEQLPDMNHYLLNRTNTNRFIN